MKSREQIAIEALTDEFIDNACYGYGFRDFPSAVQYDRAIVRAVFSKLAAITPPAQGSIDADGLPYPAMVQGCHDYYSAGQMRAYGQGLWKQALAEADIIHKGLVKTMAESNIADRAARKSAAPGDGDEEITDCKLGGGCQCRSEDGCASESCKFYLRTPAKAAPAPSEPVPQGVPEGHPLYFAYTATKHGLVFRRSRLMEYERDAEVCAAQWLASAQADWGYRYGVMTAHPTATTATSGGEAVAWCAANPNGENQPVLIYGNGAILKPGDKLYLAPPPLPATDAASVLPDDLREVCEFLLGSGTLEDCWFGEKPARTVGQYWWRDHLRSAIRALISKEDGHAN